MESFENEDTNTENAALLKQIICRVLEPHGHVRSIRTIVCSCCNSLCEVAAQNSMRTETVTRFRLHQQMNRWQVIRTTRGAANRDSHGTFPDFGALSNPINQKRQRLLQILEQVFGHGLGRGCENGAVVDFGIGQVRRRICNVGSYQ